VFDSGDGRGDDAHQRAGGVGGSPSRDVGAGAFDGRESLPEFPTVEVVAPVLGNLPFVERADVGGGVLDGRAHAVVYLVDGALGGVGHVEVANRHIVELLAVLADRRVTFLVDTIDNLAHVVANRADTGVALEQCRPLVGPQLRNLPDVHTYCFPANEKRLSESCPERSLVIQFESLCGRRTGRGPR
jgi:hypothetical protein